MPHAYQDGERFYEYAMDLFYRAGHISTLEPEFCNHSPEQFVYFDNLGEASLSKTQREMFRLFNNVSRLFTANGCAFFSMNLLASEGFRSQVAHDIHTMVHPLVGTDGSICLFRYDEETMISFVGYGKRCILSDWYPIDDDYERLLDRLDIANMSIQSGAEYFFDFIYALARNYYLVGHESTVYDLLPIDFMSHLGYDELDREELDQIVKEKMTAYEREYGDDYVEYDETAQTQVASIGADLDLMLFEMEDEDDNPFGEEIEDDEVDQDEDEYADEEERDEYEFEDVDPEIFHDPTLMVKWINKHE